MKLARKIALPFIAGSRGKKKKWSTKDILIVEECSLCETSQAFLSLMLHLIDVLFLFSCLFNFFLAEGGVCLVGHQ